MDVHGECPDLLAPASAYRRLGGAFWVATDACGTVIATVGWRPLDAVDGGTRTPLRQPAVAASWPGRQPGRPGGADRRRQRRRHIELWSDSRFLTAHRFYERFAVRPGAAPTGSSAI